MMETQNWATIRNFRRNILEKILMLNVSLNTAMGLKVDKYPAGMSPATTPVRIANTRNQA